MHTKKNKKHNSNKLIPFQHPKRKNSTPSVHTFKPVSSSHNRKKIAAMLPLSISIVSVLIAMLSIFGPYLIKELGSVKIMDSYIMPYLYADTAFATPDSNFTASSDNTDNSVYQTACAVRTAFSSSKIGQAQATDNVLNVYRIESCDTPDLQYFSLADKNTVKFYLINCGSGSSDNMTLQLQAHLYQDEHPDNSILISDWSTLFQTSSSALSVSGSTLTLDIAPLPGGNAVQYYSFEISEWALEQLKSGSTIYITSQIIEKINPQNPSPKEGPTLGFLRFFDNHLIVEHGGAGVEQNTYTNYAYIDVDAIRNDAVIPIHSTFPIQDRAVSDTVIVPDASCQIEYSLTYSIDGKKLTTPTYQSKIEVPLYQTHMVPTIARFLNEHNLTYYQYHSISELHDIVAYDPKSILSPTAS